MRKILEADFNRVLDASEDQSSNPSDNRSFQDVLATNISRRTVVKGTLAGAAATAFFSTDGFRAWKTAAGGPAVHRCLDDVAQRLPRITLLPQM